MNTTTFITRKYDTVEFHEIGLGDRIQRKTPMGSRFSNTYRVTAVTTFYVGAKPWKIVECGKKVFIHHLEIGNTFRKVL